MSRGRHKMEHGGMLNDEGEFNKEGHEGEMERSEKREKHERGGQVKAKPYNAEGTEAMEEAEERKAGGRVKRKKGGAVSAEGHSTHMRMDRPRRRSGGRTGSDAHPLTTANKVIAAEGHTDTMSGDAGDDKEQEPD